MGDWGLQIESPIQSTITSAIANHQSPMQSTIDNRRFNLQSPLTNRGFAHKRSAVHILASSDPAIPLRRHGTRITERDADHAEAISRELIT